MHSCTITQPEELVADLIHALRQPIEIVGLSAECLRMVLGTAEGAVDAHLRTIAQQVERAAGILADAASQIREARVSGAAGKPDLTNSQSAVVT